MPHAIRPDADVEFDHDDADVEFDDDDDGGGSEGRGGVQEVTRMLIPRLRWSMLLLTSRSIGSGG
eukprot:791254-Rhodomonas_salina.1